MSDRKNAIIGIGEASKLTVQKSLPLLEIEKSDLTIPEKLILEVYLSRIDSHNPANRTVVFTKSELEKALGVTKMHRSVLETRLKHLMSTVVKIPDPEVETRDQFFTLFEYATIDNGDSNVSQITLTCSVRAMKYIFNIENLGYIRYKLRTIRKITSSAARLLFFYIERNRPFRKSWSVSVEELKTILLCNGQNTYQEYKYFNKLVLKPAVKEINTKTECHFTYEPVRKGRSITDIRFCVENLSEKIMEDNNAKPLEIEIQENGSPKNCKWMQVVEPFGFSREQLDEIESVLTTVPDLDEGGEEGIENGRFHYMDQKVKEIIRRDKEKSIKNKSSYLIKMMKSDIKSLKSAAKEKAQEDKENTSKNRKNTVLEYNRFEQRTYDYDELKKKLLRR